MTRIVDRGAIFAGWVGLGMVVVTVIALELILAVQSLPFLAAPLIGGLIGWYANVRSERWRPWSRVMTNAVYAGLITGLGLALLYAVVRLVFVFGDSGFRDATQGGQLQCRTGPDCTYQRYLAAGGGEELEAVGVTDASSFERYALRQQANGALILIVLATAGSLMGGAVRGLGGGPRREERALPTTLMA
ncbi:MAG: hypothetical protein H0V12_08725 [Chloroflexi bacterium]|nr:hypothetical protein [Chloroflexota bacterium]